MRRTISGVHKIFNTNQFKSIRKKLIKEAKELREDMERGLEEEDEKFVDDEKLEIIDLPEGA